MNVNPSQVSTNVQSLLNNVQILRFAVIGAPNVGKTSFCSKFLINYISDVKPERFSDCVRRMIIFDE